MSKTINVITKKLDWLDFWSTYVVLHVCLILFGRKGVYYLSVAAACFLILIIALTTLRVIVFCLVWILTLSRHHLWLLPNLTEDVGFFASFWPLYQVSNSYILYML